MFRTSLIVLSLVCWMKHVACAGSVSASSTSTMRNTRQQRSLHVRTSSGKTSSHVKTVNGKERSHFDVGSHHRRGRRRMRGSGNNHSDGVRQQRERRLGKSGKGGGEGGSSGGGSASSSGSGGSSGGSSHSGAGWDEYGNYCGCLCDSSASSSAYGSCEYAVHASDVYRIGDSDQAQNAGGDDNDTEGEEDEAADGDAADGNADQVASSSSSGQQSDVVAVVSTSDSEYNPVLAFNISESDTFCNLWQYDWLDSCNTGDCHCPFTEELIDRNRLSCSDAWDCPKECHVCLQCMRQSCGYSVVAVSAVRTGKRALPAAVAILTTFLAVCYIVPKRKRKQKDGLLGENLIDSDTEMTESVGKTWMVPVSPDGLPVEQSEQCKPVWLAPINKSDSMQTQVASALSRKIKREETAMLVVVPRPDILKDSEEQGGMSNSTAATSVGGITTENPKKEEFTPGLWLVPLSQESVASSISESVDKDDSTVVSGSEESDSRSGSSDDQASEEESGGEIEPTTSNDKEESKELVVPAFGSTANRKEDTCVHEDDSFHSSMASTISSKDDDDDNHEDRSLATSEGEI